ncbi:adenylylsulfate kinase [Arcobacter nitrofigilis DSM 7299]|uniref:Adenylyl-sulfate kinase n=2 Tax=Arcobacter nitrofigilis TaxID=28199 RepID=D5V0B9_ARCNC|nr:adenylylsulfate kinase [Arcobacter nitrofigilis DSM 7299]
MKNSEQKIKPLKQLESELMTNNIIWYDSHITKEDRVKQLSQKPCILWFTGLSGSGKSTIANVLEVKLYKMGIKTYLLDGDNIRHGLNRDLGFSKKDRTENIRRISEVAKLFVDSGSIVLTAFISPFQRDRELARKLVKEDEFIEIFIDTSLEICEQRDPKGLYKKVKEGKIKDFTGIDSPYEVPINSEIHLKTNELTIEQASEEVISYLKRFNYLKDLKE